MNIFRSFTQLRDVPFPIVLVVGTFDGLHLGHQALIQHTMDEAIKIDGTAVIMTFDRHPCAFLRPHHCPKMLTSQSVKIRMLEQYNVPVLLLLKFNKALASLDPEVFIQEIVTSMPSLHMICAGEQWSFGKGGNGNIPLLKRIGKQLGFKVSQISPVYVDGIRVNSTRIRSAIASGDFEDATRCLGHPFLLTGTVVRGAGLGSKIGFPTINLSIERMQVPPDGVYVVKIHQNGVKIGGVMNIGFRPTTNPIISARTAEVHLLDYRENFLGRELTLEFIRYLREEKKFPTLHDLIMQIGKDCKSAQSILRNN